MSSPRATAAVERPPPAVHLPSGLTIQPPSPHRNQAGLGAPHSHSPRNRPASQTEGELSRPQSAGPPQQPQQLAPGQVVTPVDSQGQQQHHAVLPPALPETGIAERASSQVSSCVCHSSAFGLKDPPGHDQAETTAFSLFQVVALYMCLALPQAEQIVSCSSCCKPCTRQTYQCRQILLVAVSDA